MYSINEHDFLRFWLAALYVFDLGPKTLLRLHKHFLHIAKMFAASQDELQALGLNGKQIAAIIKPDWQQVEKDLAWLNESHHHHIITYDDVRYPPLLKEISDPPILLFVKGEATLLSTQQIAMVGARAATPVGLQNGEQFAEMLAHAGLTVTSGLALGIDASAHRGALNVKGKTIAVMGTGLHQIYPRSNTKLFHDILENRGAIVSEFPLECQALPHHFPRRNRIIAGMSLGIIVVEAALKSGSLITARLAVENNREVFAIPGSIHKPQSRGCHYLIKQGAKLVETAADILEELGHFYMQDDKTTVKSHDNLSTADARVFDQIGEEVTPIDLIILQTGLTPSEVSSILLKLELQGLVQMVSGGCVRIVSASKFKVE